MGKIHLNHGKDDVGCFLIIYRN